MICGIYKVTNKTNQKVYIGQSINIKQRWQKHRTNAFNACSNEYNSLLHRGFRKHGLENFIFEIIKECPKKDLDKYEIYYIKQFKSYIRTHGYNLTMGGQPSISQERINQQIEIKKLLKEEVLTMKEIAKIFNLTAHSIGDINSGRTWFDENEIYPIRKNTIDKSFYCQKCNVKLSGPTKTNLCRNYYNLGQRKIKRPSKEQLIQDLKETNFTQVGKKYNVSDNTIRKWCDTYNISRKSKDYKQK